MYGIRCFLCSRVALRHLSVGAHLAARCLSQCLGWQELAALKHHATCFQALLGCSLCLPTLPFRLWRGITFAKKIHWRTLCIIVRTMVIFLNRHHQNHSKQPGKQREQDKICLSGAYMRCCYCVKSELFCPRCLNEQLFAANNSRPRDVACDSRAEGCYDWFCRWRALCYFRATKVDERKTWEK